MPLASFVAPFGRALLSTPVWGEGEPLRQRWRCSPSPQAPHSFPSALLSRGNDKGSGRETSLPIQRIRLKVNLAPLAARPQKAARGVAFQDTGDTGGGSKGCSSPAAGPCRVATPALEHFRLKRFAFQTLRPGVAGKKRGFPLGLGRATQCRRLALCFLQRENVLRCRVRLFACLFPAGEEEEIFSCRPCRAADFSRSPAETFCDA